MESLRAASATVRWTLCTKSRFFFSPSSQEDYDYLHLLRALWDEDVFQGMCHRQFVMLKGFFPPCLSDRRVYH